MRVAVVRSPFDMQYLLEQLLLLLKGDLRSLCDRFVWLLGGR